MIILDEVSESAVYRNRPPWLRRNLKGEDNNLETFGNNISKCFQIDLILVKHHSDATYVRNHLPIALL